MRNSWWSRYGILGVPLLAALLIVGAFFLWSHLGTEAATAVAESHLAMLGDGRTGDAYALFSADLRSRVSQSDLEMKVNRCELWDFASVTWSEKEVHNLVSTTPDGPALAAERILHGTVTIRSGGTMPITVRLGRVHGDWLILEWSSRGCATRAKKPVPCDDEARQMAKKLLLAFNAAVKTHRLSAFLADCSMAVRLGVSPEKLRSSFKQYIEQKIDISAIESAEATFEVPPGLDNDDRFVVTGSFATRPNVVRFRLTFVYEHPNWKLMAMFIGVTNERLAPPDLKDGDEGRALAVGRNGD